MTKLAVSIMVRSLHQALAATAQAAERGADLVEFRVDHFTDQPQQLAELVERSSLPCIVTCRPIWEGGGCHHDNHTRISTLGRARNGALQPAYIDFEFAAYQQSSDVRADIDAMVDPGGGAPNAPGLILSSHDFESRPVDLYQRIEAMVAYPSCRVMKIAWRARSLRDNIEAFEIISSRHKPTVALCMGQEGLPSRILAKKFGALLTFGALDAESATADGQPTIDEVKHLYRWDALGPDTRVFGVIGHPVAHSMSPAIHNAGFSAVDYDGVYLPMLIRPGYESFKATVSTWLDMEPLHFRGASVTLPHKQNLLRFVQEKGGQIEPLAERIGAANTLVRFEDGSLYAANTDYAAALNAVCDTGGLLRSDLADKRVAVIGAGGVARAVVAAFASCGATVVIYNRTIENGEKLVKLFDYLEGKVVAAKLENLCKSCCQIVINCTPVGMYPHVDATPVPNPNDMEGWDQDTIVFDTIYNPVETRLLRDARDIGCQTISGLEMFVRQAAEQFRLWTDLDAPLDVFRSVLADRLSKNP